MSLSLPHSPNELSHPQQEGPALPLGPVGPPPHTQHPHPAPCREGGVSILQEVVGGAREDYELVPAVNSLEICLIYESVSQGAG